MRSLQLYGSGREVIADAFAQGARFDGRQALQGRKFRIAFSKDARGKASVRLGSTECLCVASGEVVEPRANHANEGLVNFAVHFSAISHLDHAVWSKTARQRGADIAVYIEQILRRSRCVDVESLVIQRGSKVWALSVDIHVLNDGGNVRDAAVVAALAGLMHFRKSRLHEVLAFDKAVSDLPRREVVDALRAPDGSVTIHHLPISVTLAFLTESTFLIDPTKEEEEVALGQVYVAINKQHELCSLHKFGAVALSTAILDSALRIANARAVQICTQLEESLKKHEAERAAAGAG